MAFKIFCVTVIGVIGGICLIAIYWQKARYFTSLSKDIRKELPHAKLIGEATANYSFVLQTTNFWIHVRASDVTLDYDGTRIVVVRTVPRDGSIGDVLMWFSIEYEACFAHSSLDEQHILYKELRECAMTLIDKQRRAAALRF